MIKIDRICVWLFIINTFTMMFSNEYLSLLDEMVCWGMAVMAIADCIFNHRWKAYRLLWIILAILTLYAVISIFFRDYNTTRYILLDYIMFIKPFLPLCIFIGMNIHVTPTERTVLKWVALWNVALAFVCVLLGTQLAQNLIVGHILTQGVGCMTSVLIYIWCASQENEGRLTRRDFAIVIISLIIGLYCQRSKYYGEFIIILFLLFIYKPGFFSRISLRNIIIASGVAVLILIAIWKKFAYYYINPDFSSDYMGENIARISLLYGMVMILTQYPVFGAGLASFGTLPSAWNYSDLYYELNLNLVWGLSPSKFDFVADNFIAALGGQFGFIGIVLFISFLVYLYRCLTPLRKIDYPLHRYAFIVGVMVIVNIVIENTSGNLLFIPGGISQLCLLGLTISQANEIRSEYKTENGCPDISPVLDPTAS